MKDTVRKHTRRCNWQSVEEIIKGLRPSLKGWYEYFKHSNRWAMLEVDAFFRRRLRSIIAKYNRKKGSHRFIDNRKYTKKYFAELAACRTYPDSRSEIRGSWSILNKC
nr:group II intron maturase-specific domain-containing protein [Lentisphaera araneosa]